MRTRETRRHPSVFRRACLPCCESWASGGRRPIGSRRAGAQRRERRRRKRCQWHVCRRRSESEASVDNSLDCLLKHSGGCRREGGNPWRNAKHATKGDFPIRLGEMQTPSFCTRAFVVIRASWLYGCVDDGWRGCATLTVTTVTAVIEALRKARYRISKGSPFDA